MKLYTIAKVMGQVLAPLQLKAGNTLTHQLEAKASGDTLSKISMGRKSPKFLKGDSTNATT
jgi:hypothetical protein